jgi:hypothetical protein
MFQLVVEKMSFDSDLQIIQADVTLQIGDEAIIEETTCIDVGLPSMLRSVLHDVEPNRWAPSEQWEKMPFFICGCGDPECKGFSFVLQHLSEDELKITEVDEQQNEDYRVYQSWIISKKDYAQKVVGLADQFLHFVRPLDYRPFLPNTVEIIEALLKEIRSQIRVH